MPKFLSGRFKSSSDGGGVCHIATQMEVIFCRQIGPKIPRHQRDLVSIVGKGSSYAGPHVGAGAEDECYFGNTHDVRLLVHLVR